MKVPQSSYRLQLHAGFGFEAAAAACAYLAELGISDVYVSPILRAVAGSMHGYDVIDHGRISDELGGEEGASLLFASVRKERLGLIVDFVPNHMGVSENNRFWEDVLEHGRASEFADYFDIDWRPPKETLTSKLLLPLLADQYGKSIESGALKLRFVGGAIRLEAAGRLLPLRPKTLARVLFHAADRCELHVPARSVSELRERAQEFDALQEPHFDDGEKAHERAGEVYRRAAEAAKWRLAALFDSDRELFEAVNDALTALSGTPGEPATFDFLDGLVRDQAYRLCAWRLALEATNYRRFFDVNELASIRVERPEVFDAVHEKLLSLFETGKITGVRLDHIDGLFDPIGYLQKLDERIARVCGASLGKTPSAYVVVEKILGPGEQLPELFRCSGTTGYEFARVLNGLFVEPKSELQLVHLYRSFTGDLRSFDEHALDAKRQVLRDLLASEVTMLSRGLENLAETDRRYRDFTLQSLHTAITEVMAAFPVYRSYIRPDGTHSDADEACINQAILSALRRNPTSDRSVYQFLREALLKCVEFAGDAGRDFALRFQQTTAPVLAKALEDTAFYRYAPLVSANEVGGDPRQLALDPSVLHEHNERRLIARPASMIASSTHDTKRGEDTRARITALSQMPSTWRRTLLALGRTAAVHRVTKDHEVTPSRVDEYLYYQALIGIFPFGAERVQPEALSERLQAYMVKACREAKLRTSWLNPDEEYERGVCAFVRDSLADAAFVSILRRLCAHLDRPASTIALAQLVLKMCSPGVPDTYQGSELWHQVLVDPDNRRPVDFADLKRRLARIKAATDRDKLLRELLAQFAGGDVKLFVLHELLALRASKPRLFRAAYTGLDAGDCAIAFARGGHNELVCVVPRFPFRIARGRQRWALGASWGDARVTGAKLNDRYRNIFTGAELVPDKALRLSEVFADFPVAVLLRD
jgi:(1->4)-alpha-D-glucan 1-alpha-D-glucosylmutase